MTPKFVNGHVGYWKGKHFSEEHKHKISEALEGITRSEETKRKISKATKGRIPWCKGLTKETDRRVMQIAEKMTGKTLSEDARRKVSKFMKQHLSDPRNHPFWQGGKSFQPYGVEFNNQLKEQIRERDGYCCQACGIPEKTLGRRLDAHHIDFDKHNNSLKNLISMCRSCHVKLHWKEEIRRARK